MKNTNQTQTLILTVVVLLIIGALAGYNVFQNQQKREAMVKFKAEANKMLEEIEELFLDPKICTLNLKGKGRKDFLQNIIKAENSSTPAYELNKPMGMFKLDQLSLNLDFENNSDSTVKLNIDISNAQDEASKSLLGIHSFKKEMILKVDDCPTEYVKSPDKAQLTRNCEDLPPDGLGGKSIELIESQINGIPFYFLECKVCRNRVRAKIQRCL